MPPLLSGFWVRRYGRRRGLWNSLRSDSPRPFSSVFLATSPTDKGGDFASAFASLFNPLALRALPLYSFQEHRGRGGLPLLSLLRVFLRPLLVAMLLSSPLYFAAQKHPVYGTRQRRVRVTLCLLQCDTPHMGYGKGRSGIMLNFRLALFLI